MRSSGFGCWAGEEATAKRTSETQRADRMRETIAFCPDDSSFSPSLIAICFPKENGLDQSQTHLPNYQFEPLCRRERSRGPQHARFSRDGVGSGSLQAKS